MTRAAQPGAKWIDPDPAWPGDVSGVAVSGGAGEGEAAAADPPVDRFHNHENMSPEAMAESIAQLQASVAALTWRIAVLESDEGSALGVSRRLGKDVVEMGGALARRMHMLEGKIAGERPPAPPSSGAVTPPAPADLFPTRAVKPRRPRSLLFVLIVALLVIVALASGSGQVGASSGGCGAIADAHGERLGRSSSNARSCRHPPDRRPQRPCRRVEGGQRPAHRPRPLRCGGGASGGHLDDALAQPAALTAG